jgi:CubicO group peptidase (beta-lactamase class C family)
MAKLGLLFLNHGQWDGKQIVSRRWVEEATQAQVATLTGDVDPYGYGWWMVPDVEGVYRADGRGGQYIFVLPQWNMIVVTTGGGFEMDEIGDSLASITTESLYRPIRVEATLSVNRQNAVALFRFSRNFQQDVCL